MDTIVCLRAKITASGQRPCVDPEPIVLMKSAGEGVEWYNPAATNVVVQFTTTPFTHNTYSVPVGKHVAAHLDPNVICCLDPGCPTHPGPNHPTHDAPGHFKYSILDTKGTVLVDPQVIVKP